MLCMSTVVKYILIFIICLFFTFMLILIHFHIFVFVMNTQKPAIYLSVAHSYLFTVLSQDIHGLHLNVGLGSSIFSTFYFISTFCSQMSCYAAEYARKVVNYANCPNNSTKIEFFVCFSNQVLPHDASTFAQHLSKRFFTICDYLSNIQYTIYM